VIAFSILIGILLFRPEGLFGRHVRRRYDPLWTLRGLDRALVFVFAVPFFLQATPFAFLIRLAASPTLHVVALGLNLVVGYVGLLDLGFMAFTRSRLYGGHPGHSPGAFLRMRGRGDGRRGAGAAGGRFPGAAAPGITWPS